MRIRKTIYIWLLLGFGLFILSSCTPISMVLRQVPNTAIGNTASPSLFDPALTDRKKWEGNLRPQYRAKLERNVYGIFPDQIKTHIIKHEILDQQAVGGAATLEHFVLRAEFQYQEKVNLSAPFHMYLVRGHITQPSKTNSETIGSTVRPIILKQSFCPNNATIRHAAVLPPNDDEFSCPDHGVMSAMIRFVFGRYIATPPIEMILEHGYDFATMAPSQLVPDQNVKGTAALASLTKGHPDPATRLGAIGAWSIGYSHMIDAIEQSANQSRTNRPEFPPNQLSPPARISPTLPPFIAYGHSRYAKTALLAGANDPRIKAVIAHQSGTGGASLNKDKAGETIENIVEQFPHWFATRYGTYSGREHEMDFDQHALLALNAPHPILLGNAKRDIWSDPNGAFRAADAASAAYRLYGKRGLSQEKLTPFDPTADISFYLRPGTHGVVKEDWPAFLSFLDAHFKPTTR